jgi:quercetin dioxygenase-like cupin family protein
MIDISKIELREIIKGYKARFIHTENITLAFWEVAKGAQMPMHAHPQEQTAQVTEGKFELRFEDHAEICEKGFVTVIPSNVTHGGVALTDCKLFDIFYPIREDYK